MSDYHAYKEMYVYLFRETTKAIRNLQKAQQQTEEMYIANDSIINCSDDRTDNEDKAKRPLQG